MNTTVPTLTIICIAISALAGIAIPVTLFLVYRKKYRADILPFFIGCAVFFLFAGLFEGAINRFILSSSIGAAIKSNLWFCGIFFGLMAGLFEETGRYVAYKTVLKKKLGNDRNALMYGAGHGGIEAFYLLVFSMVSNLYIAYMLNAGMAETLTASVTDPVALQTLNATIITLANTPPATFLMSIVERLSAVVLQISLSVLVWFSVKGGRKRFWLYPLAILLHAFIDAVAVILSRYVSSVWIILGTVYLITAVVTVVAILLWKKYSSNNREAMLGEQNNVD